jgi:hypothetical protein
MTIVSALGVVIALGGCVLLWHEYHYEPGMRRLYFTYNDRDYVAVFRTLDQDDRPVHAPVWNIALTTDKGWQWTAPAATYPEPESEILIRLTQAIEGRALPIPTTPVAVAHRSQRHLMFPAKRNVSTGDRRWWE